MTIKAVKVEEVTYNGGFVDYHVMAFEDGTWCTHKIWSKLSDPDTSKRLALEDAKNLWGSQVKSRTVIANFPS